MFKSTMNMTYSTFIQYRTWTLTATDGMECGMKCLHFGNCNSFSFQQTSFSPGNVYGTCEGAMLSTLVDTDNGIRIFIDAGSYDEWDIICSGSEGCCRRTGSGRALCGLWEGDCNNDNECTGMLKCGNNNCVQNWGEGGLWDAEDDCCEPPCTPNHPCAEGEGYCEADADCQNPGWLKCGNDLCIDSTYFPSNLFPEHSLTFYKPTDNCCYRVCNKRYKVCGHNEVGCLNDEDCTTGLYCKKDVAQPYCEDINECDSLLSLAGGNSTACGPNTLDCLNTIGSFECSCTDGFTGWSSLSGCSDIDECKLGSHNCAGRACVNSFGSYTCGQVILVKLTGGATSKEGTVYVWNQVNQRYEGVCDDAWDSLDAAVVCRSLGFGGGEQTWSSFFGSESNYFMDDVQCTGYESSLFSIIYRYRHIFIYQLMSNRSLCNCNEVYQLRSSQQEKFHIGSELGPTNNRASKVTSFSKRYSRDSNAVTTKQIHLQENRPYITTALCLRRTVLKSQQHSASGEQSLHHNSNLLQENSPYITTAISFRRTVLTSQQHSASGEQSLHRDSNLLQENSPYITTTLCLRRTVLKSQQQSASGEQSLHHNSNLLQENSPYITTAICLMRTRPT
ncbi:fibrillin-2 [Eurytemora carolleeae]|uniref:fibrillin-2 n=1 Tax=Eurytemora carolleeae TaxID=1294199 RepID=UPI000C7747E2|nr:fibrillin-2 [Eurytemora carolleeae]|eukprot:XP_023343984.1 fibrillin-2-like [Eurytemora affinis]